jgi:hypothetical protein
MSIRVHSFLAGRSINPRWYYMYHLNLIMPSATDGAACLPCHSLRSLSTPHNTGTSNNTKTTRPSPPKFPQEALDQLFIIKSKEPPPSSWSDLLEHFRNIDGSIPIEVEHELLKRIAESKNSKLLQRATEQLEWNDPESLRLLILSWTTVLKEPKRAAQILLDWPDDIISQQPTMASFRLVLTGLSKGTNSKLATDILKLLCDKYPQLSPDRDCFHRVLSACSNDPQAAEDALLIMIQHAQKNGNSTMPNFHLSTTLCVVGEFQSRWGWTASRRTFAVLPCRTRYLMLQFGTKCLGE